MSNKSEEFVELYHSIIPDRYVRERVPVLVHGPKRLVDHTTIVVRAAQACRARHTGQGPARWSAAGAQHRLACITS